MRPRSVLFILIPLLLAMAAPAQALTWRITSMGASMGNEAPTFMTISNSGSAAYSQWVDEQPSRLFLHHNGTLYGVAIPDLDSVVAMNDNGCVLGTLFTAQEQLHGFLYCDGHLERIGAEFDYVNVMGINNQNMVIGTYTPTYGDSEIPFLYHNGTLTPLDIFGGDYATAVDINDNGDIVGSAALPEGNDPAGIPDQEMYYDVLSHAFLVRNGQVMDLGTLGGEYSSAWRVNEQGVILGDADDEFGMSQAFICRDGHTLELLVPGAYYSYASDLNDNGVVIGEWSLNENHWAPFVYHHGQVIDIPRPEGYGLSLWDINNNDIAIGSLFSDNTGMDTVIIYSLKTGVVPLKDLIVNGQGWDLFTADAIGDDNSIIGLGEYQGQLHVYLLRPE